MNTVGLKELRENFESYIEKVNKGESFVVLKRSKPVLKLSSPIEDDSLWEPVVDFTKIKKGGVNINDLLSRL